MYDACAALKELHSATKIFKVTILEFGVEKVDGVPEVGRCTRTVLIWRRRTKSMISTMALSTLTVRS